MSVAPKVEQCAEPELKAMLMGRGEPVAVSKFVEQSIVSQSLKEYPAIKLTFKGTVSIAQLKLIQVLFENKIFIFSCSFFFTFS